MKKNNGSFPKLNKVLYKGLSGSYGELSLNVKKINQNC